MNVREVGQRSVGGVVVFFEGVEGEMMVGVVGEDKVTEESIEGEEEAIGVDVASLPPKERVEEKLADVDVTEAGGAVEVDGGGG